MVALRPSVIIIHETSGLHALNLTYLIEVKCSSQTSMSDFEIVNVWLNSMKNMKIISKVKYGRDESGGLWAPIRTDNSRKHKTVNIHRVTHLI